MLRRILLRILFPKKEDGNVVVQNKLSTSEKVSLTECIAGNLQTLASASESRLVTIPWGGGAKGGAKLKFRVKQKPVRDLLCCKLQEMESLVSHACGKTKDLNSLFSLLPKEPSVFDRITAGLWPGRSPLSSAVGQVGALALRTF